MSFNLLLLLIFIISQNTGGLHTCKHVIRTGLVPASICLANSSSSIQASSLATGKKKKGSYFNNINFYNIY